MPNLNMKFANESSCCRTGPSPILRETNSVNLEKSEVKIWHHVLMYR